MSESSTGSAGAAASGPAQGAAAGAATVLVVEDEMGLAEVLALHLEAAGYRAVIAPDGLQALYLLDRERPDLVLLDLHLPEVSGFRIIQLLKQRRDGPQLPVIVLTALSYQEAQDALRAGADDFLTKPFLPQDVVTRVRQVLTPAARRQ